jgi:hypothetical protein
VNKDKKLLEIVLRRLNLEQKFRETRKISNDLVVNSFVELKEVKRSDSNFIAREVKNSKVELPKLLKQKNKKLKKHRAKSTSSLKIINSKKL